MVEDIDIIEVGVAYNQKKSVSHCHMQVEALPEGRALGGFVVAHLAKRPFKKPQIPSCRLS